LATLFLTKIEKLKEKLREGNRKMLRMEITGKIGQPHGTTTMQGLMGDPTVPVVAPSWRNLKHPVTTRKKMTLSWTAMKITCSGRIKNQDNKREVR
jgi:hypothetical protein